MHAVVTIVRCWCVGVCVLASVFMFGYVRLVLVLLVVTVAVYGVFCFFLLLLLCVCVDVAVYASVPSVVLLCIGCVVTMGVYAINVVRIAAVGVVVTYCADGGGVLPLVLLLLCVVP